MSRARRSGRWPSTTLDEMFNELDAFFKERVYTNLGVGKMYF